MLQFVPDHFKNSVNIQLKRRVPDSYMTQEMCDQAIPRNGGLLHYVPNCYKNEGMCNKTVDSYSNAGDIRICPWFL